MSKSISNMFIHPICHFLSNGIYKVPLLSSKNIMSIYTTIAHSATVAPVAFGAGSA